MSIYNKDGSIYKLDGPNPQMKNQNLWEDFTTHNMSWTSELFPDSLEKFDLKSIISPKEEFLNELTSTKEKVNEFDALKNIEEEYERVKQELEKVKKLKDKQEVKKTENTISSLDVKKTFIYCLPSFVKIKEDGLYGDITQTISYKDPTSFEGVIINQNDFFIEIWSEIFYEKESIIYPRNSDKRWWKIQTNEEKVGGYLMKAVPSVDQPSFE